MRRNFEMLTVLATVATLAAVAGCPGVTDPDACANVTCAAGESCVDGTCVADTPADPRADVTCAAGESCVDGACVADTPAGGGDATAGQAFYEGSTCTGCHGATGTDGFGGDLTGTSGADFLAKLDGTASHGGGTVDGITQADADNLAAWLAP